jgi:hypothetical protein
MNVRMCYVCLYLYISMCMYVLRLHAYMYIQGVSGGTVNILGGGSMDYSEQINSYKHVSNFQWV